MENEKVLKMYENLQLYINQMQELSSYEKRLLKDKIYNEISKKNRKDIYNLFCDKQKQEKDLVNVFHIDSIMNELRQAIQKNMLPIDQYEEVAWLLKIILKSGEFFSETREVDNLLANICGFKHDTKNTGRDRIVEWYFKRIEELNEYERNLTLKKIAKYSFINIPSDYKDWKKVLYKRGTK